MVRLCATVLAPSLLPACRVFMPERHRRLQACAETLPIFREGESLLARTASFKSSRG